MHTKRVERDRRRNGLSSDGEDMSVESDEEENDDEVVLNDEVSLSCPFYPLLKVLVI